MGELQAEGRSVILFLLLRMEEAFLIQPMNFFFINEQFSSMKPCFGCFKKPFKFRGTYSTCISQIQYHKNPEVVCSNSLEQRHTSSFAHVLILLTALWPCLI